MPKFFFLVTLSCFSYFSHAGNQFSEWRVVSPSGVSGIFGSAGAACSAGISKKESDVNESHPGEYEFQRTSNEGSYFEGGSEVYCGHEYKAVEGFPSDWSTFWPYSGATVVGGSAGCEDGKIWDNERLGCIYDPVNDGDDCNLTDRPINIATGAKFYSFEDVAQIGNSSISFKRSYNRGKWSFSYAQSIQGGGGVPPHATGQAPEVQAKSSYLRPDGKRFSFSAKDIDFSIPHELNSKHTNSVTVVGLGLVNIDGSPYDFQLAQVGDDLIQKGYEVAHRNGTFETFDSAGRLTSIAQPGGMTLSLSHNGNVTYVDQGDTRLEIEKNEKGEPVRLLLPSGDEILYQWENAKESSLGRLKYVVYPDASGQGTYTVNYFYDNENFVELITRIEDSDGRTLSKVTYDNSGWATSSETHDGVEKTTVEKGEVTESSGTTSLPTVAEKLRIVTNPLGKEAHYYFQFYNGQWKRVRSEGQATQTCLASDSVREYDEDGFLLSSTDWNGNIFEYTNDSKGREISRVEGKGTAEARTITTSWYEPSGLLNTVSDGISESIYTYDVNHNIDTFTLRDSTYSSNSRTWDYDYNDLGLLASVDGPRTDISDITSFEYDVVGNLTKITNPLGHETRFKNYNVLGLPTQIIDANNVSRFFEYNWKGQVTKTIVQLELEQRVSSYQYNNVGDLIRIDLPTGGYVSYEYDPAKRLVAMETNQGDRKEYTFDTAGNALSKVIKDAQGVVTETITSEYDELSRLIKVVSSGNYSTSFAYDANSNLLSATDPNLYTATSAFDALDRIRTQTDKAFGVTQYAYDAQDNLMSVTDPNNAETTYVYNYAGQKIQQISPDSGTTQYEYDSAGNLVRKIDARGAISDFTYDALNRLLEAKYPSSPEENQLYTYDQANSCSYGVGRLTSTTDFSGTTQYQYGASGSITSKYYGVESSNYQIQYEYNNAGTLEALVYPNGRRVRFAYDSLGRVDNVYTQLTTAAAEQTLISNVQYYPFGSVSSFVQGNGVVTNFQRDTDGLLINHSILGANTVLDRQYTYDALFNITQITDGMDSSRNQLFQYDALQRIKQAQGTYGTQGYTYDLVGNRLSKTTILNSLTPEETYNYDLGTNRLLSVVLDQDGIFSTRQLDHDLAGNLIQDQRFDGTQYGLEYGDANRLMFTKKAQQDIVSYVTNTLGQRVSKLSIDPMANDHYHYDQTGKLIAVSRLDDNKIHNYVFLNGELVSVIVDDNPTYPLDGCQGDIDSDGLKDWWERVHFGNLDQSAEGDFDGDSILNIDEYIADSNPTKYAPKIALNGTFDHISLGASTINSKYLEVSVNITDLDVSDTHSLQLINAPQGMHVNESLGAITWIPMGSQVGEFSNIGLKVIDSFQQESVAIFDVIVMPNSNPFDIATIIKNPRALSDVDFGFAMEFSKDINGDGLVDFLHGSPKLSRGSGVLDNEGEIFIHVNDGEKILDEKFQSLAGNAGNAGLGSSFVTGDSNNDGLSELFACAYNYDPSNSNMDRPRGTCWSHGNNHGVIDTSRESPTLGAQTSGNGSHMGSAIAKADFNGDGHFERLVGEYSYDGVGVDSGAARMTFSTGNAYVYGLNAGDKLGRGPIGSGDLNGDGYGDFVVGDYLSNSSVADSGSVRILYGSSSANSSNSTLEIDQSLVVESQESSYFGRSVAIGDLNGDGFEDLAVSAPNMGTSIVGQGVVYVYWGSAGGLSPNYDEKIEPSNAYLGFGKSLEIVDITGDGNKDLLIGQTGYGSNSEGGILAFDGLTISSTSSPLFVISPNKPNSGFGSNIISGDFNSDGAPDIAVADYLFEDVETSLNAGAIFIYEGVNKTFNKFASQEIDNVDSPTARVGNWGQLSASVEVIGSDFEYVPAGDGSSTFTWSFSNQVGFYEVYANWIDHSNRGTNVPYSISTTSGDVVVRINQKSGGGEYPLLGVFELPENATVTVSNDADGVVVADAIRIDPIPTLPVVPIVVDNDDQSTVSTGSWNMYSAGSGFIGADFLYTDGGSGESSFQWQLANPGGHYKVFANWLSKSNRASNAPYMISTNTGDQVVLVDQRTNGGSYQHIGTFDLVENATITLSNDANGKVIVDAIKIELEQ